MKSVKLTAFLLSLFLLAACNSDNSKSSTIPPNELSAIEYQVLTTALAELEAMNELPSAGDFVIEDLTTAGDMVDYYMLDEGTSYDEAMRTMFPTTEAFDWSTEERNVAFQGYLEANRTPATFDPEALETLGRPVHLLMGETFREYFADGPIVGWTAFYTDFPSAAGHYRLARPFIAENEAFAIIHVDFGQGALSGIGFYVLMRKQDGEWKIPLNANSIHVDWVS